MNCLFKTRKTVATFLLTIFYCQTILAAYEPWATANAKPIFHSSESRIDNFIGGNNISTPKVPQPNINIPVHHQLMTSKTQLTNKNIERAEDAIGGPTQPEMTSFKSVGSDNMVDLFSGDFSYNIPLLDVGGYPINMFYRSGITMDQEASWVGLGWNINPGTITRNLRGVPDDFDGKNDVIEKTTHIEDNKTIGGDFGGDIEIIGLPLGKLLDVNLNASTGIGVFYNNYRGWGIENNINASISAGKASMGNLTAGLSLNNNSQEGLNISPSLSVQLQAGLEHDNSTITGGVSIGGGYSYNSRSGLVGNLSTGVNLSLQQQKTVSEKNTSGSSMDEDKSTTYNAQSSEQLYSSSISFASPSYNPSVSIPITNSQFTFTAKVGGELWGVHPSGYLKGYVSKQYIVDSDITRTYPAYGYLHYQDANDNPQALMDFNREKDIIYRDKPDVPNIAVPSYTYDLFSITGEGTGGMFRAYRGDIGFVHDPYTTTKDNTDAASIDLGFGNLFHGGVDININHATTTTGAWMDNNPLANTVKFKQSDSVFEAVYLRNPGEKSINASNFYKNIGDDDVVTAQLFQASNGPSIASTNYLQRWKNKTATGVSTLLNGTTDFKTLRDKRTQSISYLTAAEASRIGLDSTIENYGLNQWSPTGCTSNVIKKEPRVNNFRQPNHMSEIDVLNADGRRYVYGLPVYNIIQKEVTFAADSLQNNKKTGMVKYISSDATKNNHHGKDNYFQQEVTSAYAHSFLLTSILSPDYVDITGNGLSDDDLGDAIKFNYTKVAGKDSAFGWRTPYITDSATYNEGLQSYVRDDRGNYIYGEKEMWYLNSVESKNMIAIFVLQKRSDLKSISETGNIATDTTKSKCLKEIDLYSKSDYIQNGANAKPIKTVHFSYTYDLCKGIDKNNPTIGKLTLKKVWFTYNGNNKGAKNPYLFFYNSLNPNYTNTAYDRWGNYKDPLQNPRSTTSNTITNAEYPYALQDSTLATANAAAWTMDSLILPSSGSIKVNYESDDYAYVQNKKAMQMFNVVGLSNSAPSSFYSGSPGGNSVFNTLYQQQPIVPASQDNLFVAIRVTSAVVYAKDVYQKYLDGFKKIYFKLKVQMPTDQWGSGYEYVPVYADLSLNAIADSSKYGILSGHNDIIWVQLSGINIAGDGDGSYSPLAKAAIQFLRLNLPSKAYPGYEVGDKLDFDVAVKMMQALGSNVINAFTTFDQTARDNGWAIRIDTARTFARLDNPVYKKFGGGLRVRSIRIYDNWKSMTGSQNQAVYGQTYDYTTIKNINGVDTRISSGVASWEPMMGGEENPFRIPLEYIDKVAPLAPVTMGYTEVPLGETFFPAPSVGYSQVRVRSIHATNIKSATGYEETKFYTSYDFPVITDNSILTPDTKKRYKTTLSDFLRIRSYQYLSMSQGFKIELNDMNGKIKSQASYAETDSIHPIASSTYYYHVDDQNAEFKHLNNSVKTVNQQGQIDTTTTIGKDIELMMDMREQHSVTEGADHDINVDVFIVFLFPIPIPSYIPLPQSEETKFQSVATTKVIQRFGILDSVMEIDKGSKVSIDNLLYDSETGDALLTRTRNEFNDTLYNFSYPAHWAYSGMGLAYQNIDAVYKNVQILNGILQPNSAYPGMLKRFESGDEIFAAGKPKISEDTPRDCSGQTGCPVPNFSTNYDTTRIWAIDSKKIDSSSSFGIVFIDRYGNPYSADNVNLRIVRSGHRNLNSPVGSLTSLKTPIKKVGSALKLVFDSTINVLNTSAINFKDSNLVKDAYYLKDSAVATMFDSTITLHPYNITNFMRFDKVTGEYYNSYNLNANNILAGYEHYDDHHDCHSLQYKYKTAVLFDFSNIPYQSNIISAAISLTPKTPSDFTYNTDNFDNCSGPYNWSGASSFYLDASQSTTYLQRITGSWYSNTDYNAIPATTVNQATISYNQYSNVSCTGLIQDVINSSQQYGLMFQFAKTSNTQDDETEYLNFCATSVSGCSSPNLTIQYSYPGYIHYYVCRSAVTQRNFNPYVYGAFGNWRSDKSFVYYGSRRESTPSNPTNTRTNGAIQNFTPYWSFGTSCLMPSTDTTTYVWNSETTLLNKKGFEIENKDPLGRYNAGAYGYNESLPVDVVQNSKYKDQFFDGFEDYGYTTQSCSQNCPVPRNIDLVTNHGTLDNSTAHSGKFSLKIASHDSAFQNFSITNSARIDSQKIKLLRDSSGIDTLVSPQGNGLLLEYDATPNPVKYSGYIQATVSGYYTISSIINHTNYVNAPQGYSLSVNGVSGSVNDNSSTTISVTVFLIAGQKIPMYVDRMSGSYFTSSLELKWQRIGSCGAGVADVPSLNLYQSNVSDNSVTYGSALCNRIIGITTDSSSLLPSFKPTQGSRMVFSAWVKEQKDCLCSQYDSNRVNFTFTRSSHPDTVISFKPTGNLIEGWQRYDTVIAIPSDALSMRVALKSTGNSPVYFDDVRMLPYNANMKSFVYDPVSLRLMAELDENNYATFYEYDDDGTLIRVKKETERGIQTIKETRSSLSKLNDQ